MTKDALLMLWTALKAGARLLRPTKKPRKDKLQETLEKYRRNGFGKKP